MVFDDLAVAEDAGGVRIARSDVAPRQPSARVRAAAMQCLQGRQEGFVPLLMGQGDGAEPTFVAPFPASPIYCDGR